MLRVGESGAAAGGSALGDGRASPDAPFQQVLRAERSAAEVEGGGEVGWHHLEVHLERSEPQGLRYRKSIC